MAMMATLRHTPMRFQPIEFWIKRVAARKELSIFPPHRRPRPRVDPGSVSEFRKPAGADWRCLPAQRPRDAARQHSAIFYPVAELTPSREWTAPRPILS